MDTHPHYEPIAIDLASGWQSVLEGASLARLESEALPAFLAGQRWFAGKAKTIESTKVIEHGPLSDTGERYFVLFVDVHFESGGSERYFLPLALQKSDEGSPPAPRVVLARLKSGGQRGWLIDAIADETYGAEMLERIAKQDRLPLTHGSIQASATAAFSQLRGDPEIRLACEIGSPTSSNSLMFIGDRIVIKFFRRLQAGINPDLEIGRYLTDLTAFRHLPLVAGAMEYLPTDGSEVVTLALAQQCLRHQGDGWTTALDELRHFFDRVLPRESIPPSDNRKHFLTLAKETCPEELRELLGTSLESVEALGRRTAEMHLALGAQTDSPRFVPEPLDGDDVARIGADLEEQAEQATRALEKLRGSIPPSQTERVDWFLSEGRKRLSEVAARWREFLPSGAKTRIHGDYHLGQVLRVRDDYFVLDFEGEPTRSMAERYQKSSPLRDVAGMLRSFHYAAYAGAFALSDARVADYRRLVAWAEVWRRCVGATFLRSYLEKVDDASFMPENDEDTELLLEVLVLTKACYELAYELNHRPDWARIPLNGLIDQLEGPPLPESNGR